MAVLDQATAMSTYRGGRGSSRGRGASPFGVQVAGTATGPGSSGVSNTSNGSSKNDIRMPRPGFNNYNTRGRASNQLRLNGSQRGRGGGGGSKPQQTTTRGRGTVSTTLNPPRAENSSMSSSLGDGASFQDRFQAVCQAWRIALYSDIQFFIRS